MRGASNHFRRGAWRGGEGKVSHGREARGDGAGRGYEFVNLADKYGDGEAGLSNP